MKKLLLGTTIATSLFGTSMVSAEPTRIVVTIENLAPTLGTSQTPHWIGFHDGAAFDIYNGNTPASSRPIAGGVSVERLAEDGNADELAEDFDALQPDGVQGIVRGPDIPPIRPGEVGFTTVLVDSEGLDHRFFSYASMVLPSNDFWYANGNPQAHPIFNDAGEFVGEDFIVTNLDVLDAGTEVNSELPEETAFFGQQTPNTGQDEGGVILDFDENDPRTFFLPPGSGGILDDSRFSMANFRIDGYPLVKISFGVAPAIVEDIDFAAELSGKQEVPKVQTRARGWAEYELREDGTKLRFYHLFRGLRRVTAAHLHLGGFGQNGPVVASLLPADFDPRSREGRQVRRVLRGSIGNGDLVGPFAGQPLDALIAAIQDGEVYINIHTGANPAGEIRGQLSLR
ncbi:MAG: spondin domain-containing protein [Pseudomonadota bacterium]